MIVKAPAELTIPRGTIIKATGGTSAYIAVEQGAKIYVDGSADSPVVMTSGSDNPQPGDWGGLVIAGKAPTNKGASPTTEVGDLTYGGTTSDDSSGSIRYLRVNILVQHLPTKKSSMAYLYLGLVLVPPLSMYRPMRQGMMESSFRWNS